MSWNMPNRVRAWVAAVLVAGMAVAMSSQPAAAQREWDLQGKIGVAVPLGDLADTQDPGVAFGLGLSRWFNNRIAFRLGAGLDMLGAADAAAADLTLWHYHGGLEFNIIEPTASAFRLHGNVGAGGTTFDVEDADSQTEFAMNGGLTAEYAFTEFFYGLVGTNLFVIFADDTLLELPLQLGFRYFFLE